MNVELIVICHNTVAEITKRHLPVWKNAGFNKISFVSPRDDAFILEGYDCYNIGVVENAKVSGCGSAVDRYIFSLTLAASKDICAVFEYDVICWKDFLEKGIPPYGHLACGKIHNDHSNKFKSNWFTHTQYLGIGSTYNLIIPHLKDVIVTEKYGDRSIAEAINLAGVKMESRSNFSTNTFNEQDTQIAIELRKQGLLSITHGVKTIDCLQKLLPTEPIL